MKLFGMVFVTFRIFSPWPTALVVVLLEACHNLILQLLGLPFLLALPFFLIQRRLGQRFGCPPVAVFAFVGWRVTRLGDLSSKSVNLQVNPHQK